MAAKGRFNPKTPSYSQDALVKCIYSYLVQSGLEFSRKEESPRVRLSNLRELYTFKLWRPCEMVDDIFKTISLTLLDEVAGSERVLASFNELTKDWTVIAGICFEISSREGRLESSQTKQTPEWKHSPYRTWFFQSDSTPLSQINISVIYRIIII